ncbi:hypothetical protein ABPG77_003531 [Micractinium sp. CCAP 211/92]
MWFFGRLKPYRVPSRSTTPVASNGEQGGASGVSTPEAAWRQLRLVASPVYSPAAENVQSWGLALACFLAAAASITTFNLLAGQIGAAAAAGGFQGDAATLELLDVRGGYSPADVAATMAAWRPKGRTLYLLVEAIDATIYFTAYRGLFLILFNRSSAAVARRWPALGWTRRSAVLPYIVAGTDLLEDALQVSATLAYSAAPSAAATSAPAWSALVGAASTVSQLKWALVPPISGFLVLLAGGALAATLRPHADGKDL